MSIASYRGESTLTTSSTWFSSPSMRATTRARLPAIGLEGRRLAEGPVGRGKRDGVLAGKLLGEGGAGGDDRGVVDIAVLRGDDEHDVRLALPEAVLEERPGLVGLGVRVVEAAGLHCAEDAAAEGPCADQRHEGEDEHEPSVADDDPGEAFEHPLR